MMRVAIGSDHAGFELKEAVKSFLAAENCEVLDVGTRSSTEPVDYADFAQAVCAALRGHSAERGIIMCGSGVGASMAANKVPGIRAGLCHDTYSAHQGVEHDDMNVLVLGGRVVGVELARELIHAFLGARFSGEARHLRRLAKVAALENPVRALQVFGQSVWLDYIRRSLITSGELRRLIDEDGLRGLTSNPSIFEKAIAGSSDYRTLLEAPGARGLDAKTLYEQLAVRDVQDAADALRGVYELTARRDGYVSLEVSPLLASDTAGTLEEARRLWRAVGRENLMIKVPATAQGIAAIGQLIKEGINVNATLLFARDAYEQVAEAYISGLERFAAGGGDPARIAGVASFFVSRVDTAIDEIVSERLRSTTDPRASALLRSLPGKVAIANAKLAYQRYREIFGGPRWRRLADQGARTQRLLWASTGTKDPSYPDVLYVEELVGPDTVNTMPPATLDAFRDHGRPRARLTEDIDSARDTMATVGELGISMPDVTARLLADGVGLFSDAFRTLLKTVERQSREAGTGRVNRLTYRLPAPIDAAVKRSLEEWQAEGKARRIWQHDASLWSGKDEAQWLGWLGITNDQLAHVQRFSQIADAARSGGFSHLRVAGHGRLQPLPRGDEGDLRKDPGLPGAAHPRLHRPRAGEGAGSCGRSRAHAVHRVEQVGVDAGAEHLQAVFLRPRGAAGRPPGSGPALRRDHGPSLQDAARRRGRRVPARILRVVEHRRTLLGALGLRPRARRGDGRRRGQVPGPDRDHGERLHAVGAGGRKSGRRARQRSWASRRSSSGATS